MALLPNELFGGPTSLTPQPRLGATALKVVKMAAQAGGPTLPIGTPVTYDSVANSWKVFTQGGMNGTDLIRGFIYDAPVTLDASDEVHAVVLIRGYVYEADVNTAAIRAVLLGSPSEANVQAALRGGDPTLRELGIDVRGLTQIR